jgi:hypothetical protein
MTTIAVSVHSGVLSDIFATWLFRLPTGMMWQAKLKKLLNPSNTMN